jgi:hypothetical protein
LREDSDGVALLDPAKRKVVFPLLRSGCQRNDEAGVEIELLENNDWAREVPFSTILLKADVRAKYTPSDFPLVE